MLVDHGQEVRRCLSFPERSIYSFYWIDIDVALSFTHVENGDGMENDFGIVQLERI